MVLNKKINEKIIFWYLGNEYIRVGIRKDIEM